MITAAAAEPREIRERERVCTSSFPPRNARLQMRRQKGVAAKSEVYLNPHLSKVHHFGDCYKKAKKIATQPDYAFAGSFFSGSKRSSGMVAWARLALIAPPWGDFVSHHRERRRYVGWRYQRRRMPSCPTEQRSRNQTPGKARRQAESQAPPKSSQQATILRCSSTNRVFRGAIGTGFGLAYCNGA